MTDIIENCCHFCLYTTKHLVKHVLKVIDIQCLIIITFAITVLEIATVHTVLKWRTRAGLFILRVPVINKNGVE